MWMSFVVDFNQFFCGDVGVALGSTDRTMTKHFLNHADVGTVTYHCGGKGVKVFPDNYVNNP